MKLSIIIPAHNEEDNIADVVRKVESTIKLEHELVVINDHSTDNTKNIIDNLCVEYPALRLIDSVKDAGFANAIKTGFENASGDFVVPVMGDLCDDLNSIPEMMKLALNGFDVVCGSRYIKNGRRLGGSKFKGVLSMLAGWSIHFILGVPTHDIANAFKLYRMKVIRSMTIESSGFEISMELPIKAYFNGFKITEVPTTWKERSKGKSSFKVFKLLPNYLKIYAWAVKKRIFK
ncbi:MAG: glycosyltransferase family 2 protein [Candidatus Omnitrophica bacterium]|nr:glycosyltransferase family 2 protein [Candidatus Omnitrophota bacterium]